MFDTSCRLVTIVKSVDGALFVGRMLLNMIKVEVGLSGVEQRTRLVEVPNRDKFEWSASHHVRRHETETPLFPNISIPGTRTAGIGCAVSHPSSNQPGPLALPNEPQPSQRPLNFQPPKPPPVKCNPTTTILSAIHTHTHLITRAEG